MSAALRKGWCPGALRPMAAGDGLVVRLRITGGILAAGTARALAELAVEHGNGRFDLTSHANLQMRGVTEAALPPLLDALRALRLVDADADAEAVRNVVASPLAGLHGGLDIRPLVAAIEARFAGTRALHDLPPKFLVLVDDGGMPSLAEVAADVRFEWCSDTGTFAIGLGGTRADAVAAVTCTARALVDCAEAIARGALAGFARVSDARRMRTLLASLGAAEVLRLCSLDAGRDLLSPLTREAVRRADEGMPQEKSPHSARGTEVRTLAAPYGRLDAPMLRIAADLAAVGLGELRLTPWRSLMLPGVACASMDDCARRAGWIDDDADPRLAIAACVGAPECVRATVRTRADADALAEFVALPHADRPTLHISGCAKGCALAGAAPVVLVGRCGRYDLVRDGRAADAPILRDLDLAAARAALAALLA